MLKKLVSSAYLLLFFATPLLLYPKTSEVFEFNKLVSVYTLTIVVLALWAAESLIGGKLIFRRTALDLPLAIFLLSQTISTVFSIDRYTSVFGYYGRFHGGLLSMFVFAILYWGFVALIDHRKTAKFMWATLISGVCVAIYGVAQHFGIDATVWTQDVQSRVFSTLGQPNWLAAWLVALIPLVWAKDLHAKDGGPRWLASTVYAIFFLTLLYTQSRSGLLGFIAAFAVFWGYQSVKLGRRINRQAVVALIIPVLLWFAVGVPRLSSQHLVNDSTDPASTIETRKLVWAGAIKTWQTHPLVGTGPETFAYTYPGVRPAAHNLLTEWDYVYNKAHNEYLNFLANTGLIGLLGYLYLLGATGVLLFRTNKAYLASYVSILVTNFFGFSVTPISVLLFLLPALAVVESAKGYTGKSTAAKAHPKHYLGLTVIGLASFALLLATCTYYRADLAYAKGKRLYVSGKYSDAVASFTKATHLTPGNPLFHADLANALASLSVDTKDPGIAQASLAALAQANTLATTTNIELTRDTANIYIKLGELDPEYYAGAEDELLAAIALAPTDPRLWYNLALVYLQLGDTKQAVDTLVRAVKLKPNYSVAVNALEYLKSEK